jgi:hypothetical protein
VAGNGPCHVHLPDQSQLSLCSRALQRPCIFFQWPASSLYYFRKKNSLLPGLQTRPDPCRVGVHASQSTLNLHPLVKQPKPSRASRTNKHEPALFFRAAATANFFLLISSSGDSGLFLRLMPIWSRSRLRFFLASIDVGVDQATLPYSRCFPTSSRSDGMVACPPGGPPPPCAPMTARAPSDPAAWWLPPGGPPPSAPAPPAPRAPLIRRHGGLPLFPLLLLLIPVAPLLLQIRLDPDEWCLVHIVQFPCLRSPVRKS